MTIPGSGTDRNGQVLSSEKGARRPSVERKCHGRPADRGMGPTTSRCRSASTTRGCRGVLPATGTPVRRTGPPSQSRSGPGVLARAACRSLRRSPADGADSGAAVAPDSGADAGPSACPRCPSAAGPSVDRREGLVRSSSRTLEQIARELVCGIGEPLRWGSSPPAVLTATAQPVRGPANRRVRRR